MSIRYFTGPWPEGARGALVLSFDVDVAYAYTASVKPSPQPPTGETIREKNPRSLASLSRGLYGLEVGLPRIEKLLAALGLKATFFVPSANIERWPDVFRRLRDAGHELAAHGHEHEDLALTRKDPESEAAILGASLEAFHRLLEVRPVGYRSPAWDMNAHSPGLLADAGFAYDSSLFAGEAPYRLSEHGFGSALIELPIDWSLDDAPYFLFFKPPVTMAQFHNPADVQAIWLTELDGIIDEGGCFTLTCHPSIIGRHHRIAMVEAVVRHAKARGDVWIATAEQVATHVAAHWDAAP